MHPVTGPAYGCALSDETARPDVTAIVQSWLFGVGWVVYGGHSFGRWFYDARLQAWADSRQGRGEPGGGEQGEQGPGSHSTPLA
jgi:hypothetical protein